MWTLGSNSAFHSRHFPHCAISPALTCLFLKALCTEQLQQSTLPSLLLLGSTAVASQGSHSLTGQRCSSPSWHTCHPKWLSQLLLLGTSWVLWVRWRPLATGIGMDSAIGHTIGSALTSAFRLGSSAPAQLAIQPAPVRPAAHPLQMGSDQAVPGLLNHSALILSEGFSEALQQCGYNQNLSYLP